MRNWSFDGLMELLRRLRTVLALSPAPALPPEEFAAVLREIAEGQRRLDEWHRRVDVRMDEVGHKLDRLAVTAHAEAALVPYDYPALYREHYPQGVRSIHEQIDILGTLFEVPSRDVRAAHEYAGRMLARPLPEGAEGLFAAIRPSAIKVRQAGEESSSYVTASYTEAVDYILRNHIVTTFYRFKRNLFSTTDMQGLCQEPFSRQRFSEAVSGQTGPIVVFPAQFGKLYANVSATDVRSNFVEQGSHSFGLGLFTVCCMLLTHPERFAFGALGVSCPGDMCHIRGDKLRLLDHVPGISYDIWLGQQLELRQDRKSIRYRNMGPATGFLFPPEKSDSPPDESGA